MSTLPKTALNSTCNFCGAKPVTKTYPAGMLLICDSEWDVCGSCTEFIDQNRWNDLAERVTEEWSRDFRTEGVALDFEERERLKRIVLYLHSKIREAMGRTA